MALSGVELEATGAEGSVGGVPNGAGAAPPCAEERSVERCVQHFK